MSTHGRKNTKDKRVFDWCAIDPSTKHMMTQ